MKTEPVSKKEEELRDFLENCTFAAVWLIAAFSTSFACYMLFFE